tara:strand:- start:1780 stop:2271 length:492 start_codon:yes stop_codon:yes gene_type:complete
MMSFSFVAGILVASLLWRRELTTLGFATPKKREPGQKYPFVRAPMLLTELESTVLDILQHEAGSKRVVFCKIQLTAIATIPPRTEREEFLKKLAGTRRLDFVIANADNYAPILGIQMPTKGEDLEIITDAMEAIKMPLVVLPNKKSYDVVELHELIMQATQKN